MMVYTLTSLAGSIGRLQIQPQSLSILISKIDSCILQNETRLKANFTVPNRGKWKWRFQGIKNKFTFFHFFFRCSNWCYKNKRLSNLETEWTFSNGKVKT